MIYAVYSFAASLACLIIYMAFRGNKIKKTKPAEIELTAASVRITFFLCLCAVPFFGLGSALLNNLLWAYYAESAVIVEAIAMLLIGLMALLQRYGSIFFKMQPAMSLGEIMVLIITPVVMYLSYLPANFLVLYLLGPGLYSAYLTFTHLKIRLKPASPPSE